jgi:DNA-binding XRE family transcriptional regulator
MPRKPRFIHPVRQVRTCLGYSQPAFAKLVGCSAIAIQRIENGTLQLSPKLAHAIMENTAADPSSLRAGKDATAKDMIGEPYSKKSLALLKGVLPFTDKQFGHYLHALIRYLELLLISSNRGSKFKVYGVNAAIQGAFLKIAQDFNLEESIDSFLREKGSMEKRIYRVGDLRKFPDYARIIGFKDNRKYKSEKLITFSLTRAHLDTVLSLSAKVDPNGDCGELHQER